MSRRSSKSGKKRSCGGEPEAAVSKGVDLRCIASWERAGCTRWFCEVLYIERGVPAGMGWIDRLAAGKQHDVCSSILPAVVCTIYSCIDSFSRPDLNFILLILRLRFTSASTLLRSLSHLSFLYSIIQVVNSVASSIPRDQADSRFYTSFLTASTANGATSHVS